MSTATHTPGPWTTGGYTIKARNGLLLVAKVFRAQENTDPEGDANARLIAAAPDMLDALKQMVAWHTEGLPPPDQCRARANAEAAIAKAEGRS